MMPAGYQTGGEFHVTGGAQLVPAHHVIDWMVDQIEPLDESEPVLATLEKRALIGKNEAGADHWRVETLSIEDWAFLDSAWFKLPPVGKTTRSAWQQYRSAFNEAKKRADANIQWELQASFQHLREESEIRRTNVRNRHFYQMDGMLKAGTLQGLRPDRTPATSMQQPGVMLTIASARAYVEGAGFEFVVEPLPSTAAPHSAPETTETADLAQTGAAEAKAKAKPRPSSTNNIRWTDGYKAEVRAYRDKHGLKKTAEHYGVSQALISRHVPAKEKAETGPWGGLGKR